MNRFQSLEKSCGGGLFLGLVIGLAYTFITGAKFYSAFPYLIGFVISMGSFGLPDSTAKSIPRPFFLLGVFFAGSLGGLVSYALSPRMGHIAWYLIGGGAIFLLHWGAQIRNRRVVVNP